jgi:hypothetical protein
MHGYRDSSQIELTSHLLPPSAENDCSIRADCGEMAATPATQVRAIKA